MSWDTLGRIILAVTLTAFMASAVALCVIGYQAKATFWREFMEDRRRVRDQIAAWRAEEAKQE